MPRDGADPHDRLDTEAEYYRRRADELGGEILRLDYVVSGLRHELRQKRQAFAILSRLQQSVAANVEMGAVLEMALVAINTTLAMDKTVVLTSTGDEHHYRPLQWLGFAQGAAGRLSALTFEFPREFAESGSLVVNRATSPTPLIEQLRAGLELPYFVCIPVTSQSGSSWLLLSGRLKEARPLYPPFNRGDVETLQAIARFVASYVGTVRLHILEETDRLRDRFFANLSHELRTPITLTLGPLEQIIAGRYGDVPSAVGRQLQRVCRSQEHLLGLVNQILELAKLEAGEASARVVRMSNMNQFVEEHADRFRPLADRRGLDLRLSLDPTVEAAELFVDRERFSQLLVNLLSNAFKFTKRGHVEVATAVAGEVFSLTVSDTGIGIKGPDLSCIFDRFRQADAGDTREYPGTGIGLALVREIAALHGGTVFASSEYGKGSSFRVTIPLGRGHIDSALVVVEEEKVLLATGTARPFISLPEAETGQDEAESADADRVLDPSRATVLYAEDSADLRQHVRDLLAADYNVVLAHDGRDALEKALRTAPDIIIADQMMPRMSGRDLLRFVRADPQLRAIPVIFLTARADTEAMIESLDAGADDYLPKPFHAGELLARIRNLLHARAQERELARLNRELNQLNQTLEERVQGQVSQLERLTRLKRFFSPQLAELIVAGGTEDPLRSHRCEVAVVFVDLRGFTAFSETTEPEEVMAVLRQFHAEMGGLIMAHEGTLERFTGDGLMIFFNDPIPISDPAGRAVRMALAMRDRVYYLAMKWRQLGYELDLGIGIAQGYATIGAIGFEGRLDYGAIGAVTNLAARLCNEAKPGQILISQRVLATVDSLVEAEAVGVLSLKGFQRPVAAYDVRCLRPHSP